MITKKIYLQSETKSKFIKRMKKYQPVFICSNQNMNCHYSNNSHYLNYLHTQIYNNTRITRQTIQNLPKYFFIESSEWNLSHHKKRTKYSPFALSLTPKHCIHCLNEINNKIHFN